MQTFSEVYLFMLNNLWDMEDQLFSQLPRMNAHAKETTLQTISAEYFEQKSDQRSRIEELLAHHGAVLPLERDLTFQSLLHDIHVDLLLIKDLKVRDTFLAASLLTVEYFVISRYQILSLWSRKLKDQKGETLILKNLSVEEDMRKKLIDHIQNQTL